MTFGMDSRSDFGELEREDDGTQQPFPAAIPMSASFASPGPFTTQPRTENLTGTRGMPKCPRTAFPLRRIASWHAHPKKSR